MKKYLYITVLSMLISCGMKSNQEKALEAFGKLFVANDLYDYHPLSSTALEEINAEHLQLLDTLTYGLDTITVNNGRFIYFKSHYMMEHKFKLYDKTNKKWEEINTTIYFNEDLDRVTGSIEKGKFVPMPYIK